MKKILKIGALVLAILLIAGVCWFVNGLVGNPVSLLLAKKTAEEHIAENYADMGFEVEDVSFSFKDGYYYAHINDPDSLDKHFSLTIRMDGKLLLDTYEDRIVRRENTARRLRDEYRTRVDGVLNSPAFPYDVHIGYGDILFVSRSDKTEYNAPDYAIITDDLTLDGFYDVNKLGAEAGELCIYIHDGTVTVERLSEILLHVRRIFDESGVSFYNIDCVLEYPRSEDGSPKEGRVEVQGFLYTDIYEEGLADRVAASNKAAEDYYAEQDAEKFGESEIK